MRICAGLPAVRRSIRGTFVMTQTGCFKDFLHYAFLNVLGMIGLSCYILADTFFIGQTHDALQVAAVSLATPVFLIFMALGTIFGIGGTSVISRAMGEGKEEYAKKVCSFCMWGCVGTGIVISVLFLIFMDHY